VCCVRREFERKEERKKKEKKKEGRKEWMEGRKKEVGRKIY
jgi:hypothetical protein